MPVRKKIVKKKTVKSTPKKKSKFSLKRILAPFIVLVAVAGILTATLVPKTSVLSSQTASMESVGTIPSLFSQKVTLYPTVLAKNASGKLVVDAIEHREWIGGKDRIMFRVNGELTGLVPGTPYQLWLCYNTSNTNCTAQPNGIKADSAGKIIIKDQLLDVVSSISYKFKVRDVPPSGAPLPKDTCSLDTPCLEATFNYVGGMEQSSSSGTEFNITAVCQTYGHAWLNRGHIDVQIDLDNAKNSGKWNTVTLRESGKPDTIRVIGMSPSTRTIKGVKFHGNAADAFTEFKDAQIIRFEDNKKYILEVWDGDYRSSLPGSGEAPYFTKTLITPICNIVSTPTPSYLSPTNYPTKVPSPTEARCGNIKLESYKVYEGCAQGTYKKADFTCTDGYGYTIEAKTCQTQAQFKQDAYNECQTRTATCVSTPTSTYVSPSLFPTKTPTPNVTTPTPTGKLCSAKVQYVNTKTACKPFKSGSTTGMNFGCSDGYVGIRSGAACTSAAAWYSIATRECAARKTPCK